MKKKGSTATKAVKKNTPAPKKSGRGGARPGAGRTSYVGPMKQFNCDLPEVMLNEIKGLGITNKTDYLAQLIIADMKTKGVNKATINDIEAALEKVKK